jgi:chromate transport protein ChrA
MRKSGDLAIEIVASVWLMIVAAQFLDRYFGTSSLDLTYTYWAMLAILVIVSVVRLVRRFARKRQEPSTIASRMHE